MDGQNEPNNILMSQISVEGILDKLMDNDEIDWKNSGTVDDMEYKMTKHGEMVKDIHIHFGKLEPEYCSKIFRDSVPDFRPTVRQTSTLPSSTKNSQNSCSDTASLDEPENCRSAPSEVFSNSPEFARQTSHAISIKRKRHLSEGPHPASPRRPSTLLRESLALGRSPNLAGLGFGDSKESLQSRGSDNKYENISRPSEFSLYRACSLCCAYPVLYSSAGSEEDLSQMNVLPAKDFNRSMSEKLCEYLRSVFNISNKKHRQYQEMNSSQNRSKSEILDQRLREQLRLLETNSHPYYSPGNFQCDLDRKLWQDEERLKINELLGDRTPKSSRQRHTTNPKNRCHEYRDILKKVMAYDIEQAGQYVFSSPSLNNGNSSASDSNDARKRRNATIDIISKYGKRLLGEFAARHRVGIITQLCFYLESAEECIENGILLLNNTTFITLTRKLDLIYSLVEEGKPICISELDSLLLITGSFIQRVKKLVTTLLTEWLPTIHELQNCLQLARASIQVVNLLHGNEDSEWPDCLSTWLKLATVEKYHSHKKAEFQAIPETVLASVTHAVDVFKTMENEQNNDKLTDYKTVFTEYISDYHHAIGSGLYNAVMADVEHLAQALSLIKTCPPVRPGFPGQTKDLYKDSLDLNDIGLAYKLDEFEKLVQVGEIDSKKQNHHGQIFTWRKAYHPLAMHWLDVLSVHMKRQVSHAVSRDKFESPDFEDNLEMSHQRSMFSGTDGESENPQSRSSIRSKRMRMGSLIRKDIIAQNQILDPSAGSSYLGVVEEQIDSLPNTDVKENVVDDSGVSSDSQTNEYESFFPHKSNNQETMTKLAQSSITRLNSTTGKQSKDRSISEPVLLSYKPIVEDVKQEDSSRSSSFRSCASEDSTNSVAVFKSVSDSVSTNATVSMSGQSSELDESDSHTVVSDDGDSSILPGLIPAKLQPQSSNRDGGDEDLVYSENSDKSKELNDRTNGLICNVSSSLIDVVSVITRFVNFVKKISETIYNFKSEYDSDMYGDIDGMRRRFLEKATHALCVVLQQYANNLLYKEFEKLPKDKVKRVIGDKLYRQVIVGTYNESITQRYSSVESFLDVMQDENLWVDDIRKKMLRLNNLLVLKHGMTQFWQRVQNSFSIELNNDDEQQSVCSSQTSKSSVSQNSQHGDYQSLTSGAGNASDQDTSSSDETPITSSSACTVVRHDKDIQNNNGNNTDSDASDSNEQENRDKIRKMPVYENVDFESGPTVNNLRQDSTTCFIHILKERAGLHLQQSLRGVSNFLALHASDRIGYFLYQALEWPNNMKTKKNDNNSNVHSNNLHSNSHSKQMLSKLNSLLDLLATWTHQEGIVFLHKAIWHQIILCLKDQISKLGSMEQNMQIFHAENIQIIFKQLVKAWYQHPSHPNDEDLEWLSEDIQPCLTLLGIYCMSTPTLLDVFNKCRYERLDSRDIEPRYSSIREHVILCIRALQDRKSFTGELLCHTLLILLMKESSCFSTDSDDENSLIQGQANNLCQKMLDVQLIEFVFKKQLRPKLPDVILVHSISDDDLHSTSKNRVESVSTGSTSNSTVESLESEDSIDSTESEMQTMFRADSNHYYKFSGNRLPLSISDDVRRATNCSTAAEEASFFVDLLKRRSSTDRDAKLFLIEKGFVREGVFSSCFGCLR